jgi:hypothetical protein
LKNDSNTATDVLTEIGGADNAHLWYTTVGDTNFIQLDIIGSAMIQDHGYSKNIVGSYCATQLYKRLDPKTIKSNSAIQILFDGEDDGYGTGKRPHYYDYSELQAAWNAFNNIEGLVKSGINKSRKEAQDYLDSSHTKESAEDIVHRISEVVQEPISGFMHFYDYYYFISNEAQDSVICFNIVTNVVTIDSSFVPMRFLAPIESKAGRIMKTNI